MKPKLKMKIRNAPDSSGNSDSHKGEDNLKIKAKDESCVGRSEQFLTINIPKWLYCYIPVLVMALAILTPLLLAYRERQYVMEKTESLGVEVLDIFANYDMNGDFYLSLEEAEPLLLQFVDQSKNEGSKLNLDVIPGEASVEIQANFTPLNISTMTKDFEHDLTDNQSFVGLFNWKSVNIPSKKFALSKFKMLLPDMNTELVPGMVYDIIQGPKGMFGTSNLPSNRFYPPRGIGAEYFLYRLLSMFHPRPFVMMRFPPQGVKGCVRAVCQDYIEVILRMHIEFQLNEPPSLPFWYTPAQLTGSLMMSRDGSNLKYFSLHVPNGRSLNVDMEWLTDENSPESMEVDIGYMPQMELTSHGIINEKEIHKPMPDGSELKWTNEISKEEADRLLGESFFPFKKIKYHNVTEAFQVAKDESKLVHSIMLWGALDDQSC